METEATTLLVNRSGSPRFEIRGHGVLIEVVDSDCKMVYFAWGITWSQDQKTFPKCKLVVPVPFVYGATECALIEIGGSLQIADEKRDVIDTVSLESRRRRRSRAGRQQSQSLNQLSP
jgi:hypothetical protein